MDKKKVLFVCIHNSARSQMAEALLRQLAGDRFEVESAGIEPRQLNPLVIEALKEEGIDITGKLTQSVAALHQAGRMYDYVITVCDEGNAEKCPIFLGEHEKLHWGFSDPSQFQGTPEEKLARVREICVQIKEHIEQWIKN